MWGDIATSFLLAFIISFVVTPYTIRLAKKREQLIIQTIEELIKCQLQDLEELQLLQDL
jgi:hypothetical protein